MSTRMPLAAKAVQQSLGSPLAEYLADQREAGKSWDSITFDLYSRTGLEISRSTLRNWAGRAGVA